MNYCCYILYSKNLNKFYIGFTCNLNERLLYHKKPEKHKFTYNANDWELFYKIDCKSKSQALNIEKHIKSMKSKVYIENLIKYKEITTKLLERYK